MLSTDLIINFINPMIQMDIEDNIGRNLKGSRMMKKEKDLSRVGIVGATGLVGSTLLQILEQSDFPISKLYLFASRASKGRTVTFRDHKISLNVLEKNSFKDLGLLFFVTEASISKEWVPIALEAGAFVIDNSATFRMDRDVPLVVPEVNGHLLKNLKAPALIANPNCSSIQLAMALHPLYKNFGIETIRVATYQSVSGSGKAAVQELTSHTQAYFKGQSSPGQVYPHDIAFNHLPHIGDFNEEGFSTEEQKMRNEMRKILGDSRIKVTAFCVRTPTFNGHSEAVWVSLQQKATKSDILSCLNDFQGLKVKDHPYENQYPLIRHASGDDLVWVGRLHRDPDDDKTWLMWVVADNVRKGAALNAVQIAQHYISA